MPSRMRVQLNKKFYQKSIYINFSVSGNTYGGDPHSLNSRKEKEKLLKNIQQEIESTKYTIKPDEKFDVATFEFRNEQTGLKILHKINILNEIDHQDVFKWTLAFKEIARVCQWDENAQIEVLRHIVAIDIQYRIGGPTDVKCYLQSLLKLKYNNETAYIYNERLSSMSQKNFYTIRKYAYEVEDNCRKLGMCMGWSDSLINQKAEEVFMNGLDKTTKLELSKFFKKDYKSIYESILSTETMLIENLQ
ncbi:hypothetical protein DMUE_4424, partial [Dictyocoela muelleri]